MRVRTTEIRRPYRRRRAQAGMSLIETLIATALLLFISVALFPLFHRSVASNISGADSTQATQHLHSEIDRVLSLPFDSTYFAMKTEEMMANHRFVTAIKSDGSTDNYLYLEQQGFFFDAKANASPPDHPRDLTHHLATGAWVQNNEWQHLCRDPVPPFRDESIPSSTTIPPSLDMSRVGWCRTSAVRQYSYSDIGEGVIDVTTPGEIVSGGHPQLFDTPLGQATEVNQIHFREASVHIQSLRPGVPSLYTRLVRTY